MKQEGSKMKVILSNKQNFPIEVKELFGRRGFNWPRIKFLAQSFALIFNFLKALQSQLRNFLKSKKGGKFIGKLWCCVR